MTKLCVALDSFEKCALNAVIVASPITYLHRPLVNSLGQCFFHATYFGLQNQPFGPKNWILTPTTCRNLVKKYKQKLKSQMSKCLYSILLRQRKYIYEDNPWTRFCLPHPGGVLFDSSVHLFNAVISGDSTVLSLLLTYTTTDVCLGTLTTIQCTKLYFWARVMST